MDFQQSIEKCLKNYANFNGRATRSEYWWVILFWLPAILMKTEPVIKRTYNPWFFLGCGFYFIAFIIWLQGYPGTRFCNPDSLIQPHGIWHVLSSFATLSFFFYFRTERSLRND